MKRYLSLTTLAILFAVPTFAQSSLLATLSHEGQISTYYGTSAFKDAMNAAQHGDAITISAGQYTAANISKAVTIHGSGMSFYSDSLTSHEPTIIQGDITISIPDSITDRLDIEGIYFANTIYYSGTLNNALFMKSRFGNIAYSTNTARLINSSFIHCRVAEYICLVSNCNACFVNSVVWNPSNYRDNNTYTSGSSFEFDNCIVGWDGNTRHNNYYHYVETVVNSYYKNCIIVSPTSGYYMPNNCTSYYSLGISYSSSFNIFKNIVSKNNTNKNLGNSYSIFNSTVNSNYSDVQTYSLTPEAQSKYPGTDGGQVGIYGGSLPYDENPSTPQITKFKVASKSTADGKLSVDIEVKAASN